MMIVACLLYRCDAWIRLDKLRGIMGTIYYAVPGKVQQSRYRPGVAQRVPRFQDNGIGWR
jgi:hypothetical protein